MSGVLARNWPARNATQSVAGGGNNTVFRKRTAVSSRVFVLRKTKQNSMRAGKISLKTIAVLILGGVVFAGAFYLYQVNNITIKGYEVKDVENRIQSLEKENQKLKIREVESKSMQNIEKSTESLDLVRSSTVSYIERKGSVAMK